MHKISLKLVVYIIIITANEIFVGVTLSLRSSSVSTDGSGHIVITDINPGDPYNYEDALICQSELLTLSARGDWFLHPTQQTTQVTNNGSISMESNDALWCRTRATITISGNETCQLVRMIRYESYASGGRALEGVFTCHIDGDSNTPVSVGIYNNVSQ